MRTREEQLNLLKSAQEEILYTLNSNKSKEVKEVYMNNAIRFIGYVMEDLSVPTDTELHEKRKRVSHLVMETAFIMMCSYETCFEKYITDVGREGVHFEELLPYLYIGGTPK